MKRLMLIFVALGSFASIFGTQSNFLFNNNTSNKSAEFSASSEHPAASIPSASQATFYRPQHNLRTASTPAISIPQTTHQRNLSEDLRRDPALAGTSPVSNLSDLSNASGTASDSVLSVGTTPSSGSASPLNPEATRLQDTRSPSPERVVNMTRILLAKIAAEQPPQ